MSLHPPVDPEVAAAEADYDLLHDVLRVQRRESMAQAAFRVLRLNIDPPVVQEVAKRICRASGLSNDQQWRALRACAQLIREKGKNA